VQSVPVRIIVIDSGSTDATLAIADDLADQIVHLDPDKFTYGRALNIGAQASTQEVHIALSSHCRLPRRDWVEIAMRNLEEHRVIATGGDERSPDKTRLSMPLTAGHEILTAHPWWGLSNHAAAWKASAWEREPFDDSLVACEDKEWSHRATARGFSIVIDPRLCVSVNHRRAQGYRAYTRRVRREIVALDEFSEVPPFTTADALRDFVRRAPVDDCVTRSRRAGRTRLLDCVARRLAAGDIARRSTQATRKNPKA
jgi:rhamnosyltransferase